MIDLSFYKGKRVFLTGHTGFKGAWLSLMLLEEGAEVTGYSLIPNTEPSLYKLLRLADNMDSVINDIRDLESLKTAFDHANPEIVIHLAAQPIVRESYRIPHYTYETNVMGTVNLLECVRQSKTVRSVLNVTTDKVYENKEWNWGYRENEPLDGHDPYSNSKSCSELVTHSYVKSFFQGAGISVSTARAGNVFGGGDFACDRIIPDCVRGAFTGETIVLRNPNSIRPYQFVLDPLYAYLMIAQRQYNNMALADCYNVGPDDYDYVSTGTLATLFCEKWGEGMRWESRSAQGPHEANFLKLDCSKLKSTLGWKPRWHVDTAVEKTVEWSKIYRGHGDIVNCMRRQIKEFYKE